MHNFGVKVIRISCLKNNEFTVSNLKNHTLRISKPSKTIFHTNGITNIDLNVILKILAYVLQRVQKLTQSGKYCQIFFWSV